MFIGILYHDREEGCIFAWRGSSPPSGETFRRVARLVCIFIFLRKMKIIVATSVCTGGSNMPPAYCDLIFESLPQTKIKGRQKPPFYFWSEWRDSNSRHPAPKELLELFSNIFRSFLVPFIPEKILFRTLVSTVSVYSKAVYGQKCGQIPTLPERQRLSGSILLSAVWRL